MLTYAERRSVDHLSAWTDAELLAAILQTPPSAGLEPAQSILRDAGGLPGLPSSDPASIVCDGVGPSRSTAVLAAVELARRLSRAEVRERKLLARPAAVSRYLTLRYMRRDQEVMGALYLDTRHRLLHEQECFRGTLSRAAVEPRAILREGLLRGAAGVILFHTHPSGDPAPSLEDLAFTRRMAEAGDAVGVRLLDHVIVTWGGKWESLRERRAF
ncbi:MAG: RadC family protein [bacterium]